MQQLAEKLIAQFAGYHAPVRFMVQEAAKRILQMDETIDYARTIQAEGVRLKAELEKVTKERNAAVRDLNTVASCEVCKHGATCLDCNGSDFEWRGVNHG